MKGIKRVLAVVSGALVVSVWGAVLYYIWIFDEGLGGIATLGSLVGAMIVTVFTEE